MSFTREDVDRFWARVDRSGGPDACWPWKLSQARIGYGQWKLRGKNLAPHRVAFELTNGPVPAGKYVCHTCDNPPCCNPVHLFAGTAADNARDMWAKGRAKIYRGGTPGEQNWRARLTEVQVVEIRRLHRRGVSLESLARVAGVSKAAICHVVARRSWRHVA